jgi:hypothetical protein
MRSIFVGYDPRETEAFDVCRFSLRRHAPKLTAKGLCLEHLRDAGLYWRPTTRRNERLWDDISEAPMATEFAISRFLTPILAKEGWALFMDCDILARRDLDALFAQADPSKAVMCVKHAYTPTEAVKMDGQLQTLYARKNWSSVMLFNCAHPANARLDVDLVNTRPGRDLHRFCWLDDDEIGELNPAWNWLVGVSDPAIDPALVHFTNGLPNIPGYGDSAYSDEWRAIYREWMDDRIANCEVPYAADL